MQGSKAKHLLPKSELGITTSFDQVKDFQRFFVHDRCNAHPLVFRVILYYEGEENADNAVCDFLQSKRVMIPSTLVTNGLWDKWWNVVNYHGIDDAAG